MVSVVILIYGRETGILRAEGAFLEVTGELGRGLQAPSGGVGSWRLPRRTWRHEWV